MTFDQYIKANTRVGDHIAEVFSHSSLPHNDFYAFAELIWKAGYVQAQWEGALDRHERAMEAWKKSEATR